MSRTGRPLPAIELAGGETVLMLTSPSLGCTVPPVQSLPVPRLPIAVDQANAVIIMLVRQLSRVAVPAFRRRTHTGIQPRLHQRSSET
jgi:hypothetical protein